MNLTEWDARDATDMSRLASGEDGALNDLMNRHSERLFHYLLRSLANEQDAADLAQDTFVRIYQNRAKFDPRQKFSTWLFAIASNLVRDRYRWRSRHPEASIEATAEHDGPGLKSTLPSAEPSPAQSLQTEERALAVRDAVAALPEELRQPLILSAYEELSHAEIASILNCSVKAVETRIYRARLQLRARLHQIKTG